MAVLRKTVEALIFTSTIYFLLYIYKHWEVAVYLHIVLESCQHNSSCSLLSASTVFGHFMSPEALTAEIHVEVTDNRQSREKPQRWLFHGPYYVSLWTSVYFIGDAEM